MADPLEFAARIDDPIEHTGAMWGAVLGAIAGIVIGIAIVAAVGLTGGAALLAIASAAVFVSGIGEFIGKKFDCFKHEAGDIAEGSQTVFVGAPNRNAARTFDKLKCHSGEYIVSGTLTIEIEGRKAARVTEETRCDGKIKKGCETVKYGGPSVQVAPKRLSGELNPWFFWGREVVDLITIFFGGRALFKDWSKLGRIYKMIDVAGLAWTGIDKGLGYTGMVLSQTNAAAAKWLGDNVTDTWWYKSVGWTVGLTGMGRNIHQWRGEQLARGATPTTGAPDVTPSVPAPQQQLALPAPQQQLALPAPQQQLALPAPQQQLALPAPQPQLALPAPQPQLALPAPQPQLALPAPQPQLALPAPQPQLALPPPSGGTPPTGG